MVVNDELRRMWNEDVVAYIKVQSQNLTEDSLSPGRDSKAGPPEYH